MQKHSICSNRPIPLMKETPITSICTSCMLPTHRTHHKAYRYIDTAQIHQAMTSQLDLAIWRLRSYGEDPDAWEHKLLQPKVMCNALGMVDTYMGTSGVITIGDVRARCDQIQRDHRHLVTSLLRSDRGIAQRTPAWYAARHTMVTASDIAHHGVEPPPWQLHALRELTCTWFPIPL